jgi:hypothetical protein
MQIKTLLYIGGVDGHQLNPRKKMKGKKTNTYKGVSKFTNQESNPEMATMILGPPVVHTHSCCIF